MRQAIPDGWFDQDSGLGLNQAMIHVGHFARRRTAPLWIVFSGAVGLAACGSVALESTLPRQAATNDTAAADPNGGDAAAPPVIDDDTSLSLGSTLLTPVGYASDSAPVTQALVNTFVAFALRGAPSLCLSLDAAANPIGSSLYGCNGAIEQLFALSSGSQLVAGKLRPTDRAYMCLTGTAAANGRSGTVSLSTCRNAAADTWSQRGHQWRHNKTQLCLSGDLVRNNTQPASLQPCDANNAYQLWANGDWNAIAQQAATTNANVPVSTMCNGTVLMVYSPNDRGTKRIIERYGSAQELGMYLLKTKQKDCQAMFQSGSQVPFYTDIRFEFLANVDSAAAMATLTAQRTIRVYTDFWANVDESEQPFSLRVDTAFAHELTHALHPLAGVPAAFVEGYANWVPYRVGLLRASEKVHGGHWTDGYSQTAFFMVWLDDQPTVHAIGERFTDKMRAQSALNAASPDWFLPWFQATLGQDPNAMWQAYQNSF